MESRNIDKTDNRKEKTGYNWNTIIKHCSVVFFSVSTIQPAISLLYLFFPWRSTWSD